MKRGRPKLAAADRRNVFLKLRLTRKEYKALDAAAKKAGLSLSDHVRKLLVAR